MMPSFLRQKTFPQAVIEEARGGLSPPENSEYDIDRIRTEYIWWIRSEKKKNCKKELFASKNPIEWNRWNEFWILWILNFHV